MHKKSQLSVFLIVGIVVLVVAITALSFQKEPEQQQTQDMQPVTVLVQNCLEKTVADGLKTISLQGGYYRPEQYIEFDQHNVALYVNYDYVAMPPLSVVETELGAYVSQKLPECIDGFKGVSDLGYLVESSSLSVEPTIGDNGITALAVYPLTIHKGATTKQVDQFSTTLHFDFKEIYDTVASIMQEQQQDPLAVHYGFLARSAYENDYFFEINQLDENSIIYSLQFNDTLNNEPYVFSFAAEYGW